MKKTKPQTKSKLEIQTFTAASVPPETEREPTALEAHNAAHPETKALREAALKRFVALYNDTIAGLDNVLHGMVVKAETLRQAGIYLTEFAETLPGKRLTRDFYEQAKAMFVDSRGQTLTFEFIDTLIRATQKQTEPIENMLAAMNWRQLLLWSSEPELLQLVGEAAVKSRIPPKDDFGRVTDFIEKPDLEEFARSWEQLKQNPNYFPGGHLRPDLRETYVPEWKPKIERLQGVVDEMRRELGI